MNPVLGFLGGILVALIGAAGVYLGVRHKASGDVKTSDAKDLWDESKAIRADQRAEIDRLERKNAAQDDEIRKLTVELATVKGKLMTVEMELARVKSGH